MSKLNLTSLLHAGLQFGHKVNTWNPKMYPYIYTEKNGIHILDIIKSARLLKEANIYCKDLASQGKTFLFIGTKKQASSIIDTEAKRSNSFYVNHRWLGGMLTNWSTLKNRIKYLKILEKQEIDKTFNLLPKQEAALRKKELYKLRKHLSGLKEMVELPDAVIIVDQIVEMTALKECRALNIPIISILDSDCDPDLVDIPIPGNDDATMSIKLILNSLASSIIEGQEKKLKK